MCFPSASAAAHEPYSPNLLEGVISEVRLHRAQRGIREMTRREYDITLMHQPLQTLTLSLEPENQGKGVPCRAQQTSRAVQSFTRRCASGTSTCA
jgi:hypothetical protein